MVASGMVPVWSLASPAVQEALGGIGSAQSKRNSRILRRSLPALVQKRVIRLKGGFYDVNTVSKYSTEYSVACIEMPLGDAHQYTYRSNFAHLIVLVQMN